MGKRSRKQKSAWSIFFRPIKIIFFLFLTLMVLGCLVAGTVFLKYQKEIIACKEKADTIISNTKKTDFSQPSDTKIYDSDGKLIGSINSGHYEYVTISEISKNLQNAYISQEDRRFYKHHGIDYRGLLRAGVVFIKNKGVATQGGSTITQQVIKNTYLTQERTIQRKLSEFFTAPRMEEIYSKDEILEFYCNTNFYANRCYGVSEASRFYFNKEAKDLTVWEAATLAGISNNPSRYDPVAHPETSKQKRDQIINSMAICKVITEEERDYAKSQPLTVEKIYEGSSKENYQTSYAIHSAAVELMKNDGFAFQYLFHNKASYDDYKQQYQEQYQAKSDLIRNGGFEIHTSLDTSIQVKLQDQVDQKLKKFKDLQENGKYALQGAAVCVDNRTGYVVAIVGGRGTDDEFNRGFLSKRQPGSTIKPLIDYAPAFETGFYYPSRLVNDHLFDNGPKNSSRKYYGEVSTREALNRSLNTVSWQILTDIGVDKGMEYLKKMHFVGMSYLDNGNSSMSIGGFTEGARVVDMAKGYSTLANKGMYSNKTCITSIVSQYDGEVYRPYQADERVFTEDTAYMITDILKGTLDKPYGTGYGLALSIPATGKTGTTNSSKDNWFCGYTKYYTTSVWMGYDTPKAMPGIYGKTYSGKIWHDFMQDINKGLPPEDWDMPATVSLWNIDSRGEKTNLETGAKDLFSSVAEAEARANTSKWNEVEARKKQEAEAQRILESSQEALQQVEQAATSLQTLIGELQSMDHQDPTTDEKISQARGLLEQLNGTEHYDGLNQQLEDTVTKVYSLPRQEDSYDSPQEIGPGVHPDMPTIHPETDNSMDEPRLNVSPGGADNIGPGDQ